MSHLQLVDLHSKEAPERRAALVAAENHLVDYHEERGTIADVCKLFSPGVKLPGGSTGYALTSGIRRDGDYGSYSVLSQHMRTHLRDNPLAFIDASKLYAIFNNTTVSAANLTNDTIAGFTTLSERIKALIAAHNVSERIGPRSELCIAKIKAWFSRIVEMADNLTPQEKATAGTGYTYEAMPPALRVRLDADKTFVCNNAGARTIKYGLLNGFEYFTVKCKVGAAAAGLEGLWKGLCARLRAEALAALGIEEFEKIAGRQ